MWLGRTPWEYNSMPNSLSWLWSDSNSQKDVAVPFLPGAFPAGEGALMVGECTVGGAVTGVGGVSATGVAAGRLTSLAVGAGFGVGVPSSVSAVLTFWLMAAIRFLRFFLAI